MRNLLCGLLLTLAALCGTVALTAHLALHTMLEPDRVGIVAADAAATSQGRAALIDAISSLTGFTPGPAQRATLDRALADPRVGDALARTRIGADGTLHSGPATIALAKTLARTGHRDLARRVRTLGGREVALPARLADSYQQARTVAADTARTAGTAALLLAFAGIAVARSRRAALRRAGWAALGAVAGTVVLYRALPWLLDRAVGANLLSALVTDLGAGLVAPLLWVAVGGLAAVTASHLMPRPAPTH